MKYSRPITELVRLRHSCRTYLKEPLTRNEIALLEDFFQDLPAGPQGNKLRMKIAASRQDDTRELRGLGTYGFIKNPAAFLIGACDDSPGALEDFGFLMEGLILRATDLNLGSCWLGGTFTKSRFSRIMSLKDGEDIPSVVSIGHPADHNAWVDRLSRIYAGSDRRLLWEQLFFDNDLSNPLLEKNSGRYLEPLTAVRLAPSASNRQPWRIIKDGSRWHFYLHRTENYPSPLFVSVLGIADLQRIDMGIAMAHFDLTARELELDGSWKVQDPELELEDPLLEYCISWYDN